MSPTNVSSTSPVTLSATVLAGGSAVKAGQVVFCDSSQSNYCIDQGLIGTAQLNAQGKASLTRVLPPGTHKLYAIYRATTTNASSTSQNTLQTVNVTPKTPTSTVLNVTGSGGNYTFTATVSGAAAAALSGTVSFQNAQNSQVLTSTTANAASMSLNFTPQGSFAVGTSPISAAVGDLNNDGLLDLVVANNNDSSISVLLANPSSPGSFQTQTTYGISGLPYAVTVGDFNADGVLDVAVANSTYLSVLLGDPSTPGKLQAETTYAIGRGLGTISSGDFNGDGLPDLAMTDRASSSVVHIALNDVTQPGHFLNSQTIATDYGTVGVTAKDLNGDGLADLVMVSSYNSQINVRLADASNPGQFLTTTSYPTYYEPTGVAIADFNGDGILDIASIEQANVVDIFLGNTSQPGHFQSPKEITTNNLGFSSTVAADFNGDGLADLALISSGASSANVLLADPQNPGQFQPQSNYAIGSGSSTFITSGDFDHNGVPDLAVLDSSGNMVHVLQAAMTRTATGSATVSTGSASLVAANYSGNAAYAGSQSCILSLSNLSAKGPVISNLHVAAVTANSATIQWNTSIPTSGLLQYGTTSALSQSTPWVNTPTTTHSQVISGLQAGTTYSYRIQDVAFSNGCAHWTVYSAVNSFTTNQ